MRCGKELSWWRSICPRTIRIVVNVAVIVVEAVEIFFVAFLDGRQFTLDIRWSNRWNARVFVLFQMLQILHFLGRAMVTNERLINEKDVAPHQGVNTVSLQLRQNLLQHHLHTQMASTAWYNCAICYLSLKMVVRKISSAIWISIFSSTLTLCNTQTYQKRVFPDLLFIQSLCVLEGNRKLKQLFQKMSSNTTTV